MKIEDWEKLGKKLLPVTGTSFYYTCLGCNKNHLSMDSGNGNLDARELHANTKDYAKAYTFADLNGEPFSAYYCAQSLGISTFEWQKILERAENENV